MTQEKKHSETGQDCPEGYKSCDGYKIPKEWHIVRFDSLFSRVTRKNDENNQNVLTISAQQGLISQIEYYNTLYASENKTGYTLLHRGDFSYNKSYSSGYAYGAIKRLDAYEKGIVSPLYLCFTPRQGVKSDFYLQYFEAGCFDREIYKIAQEGARNHGLLNVSTEDFFHSMLVFPPLEEQERITEILTQCDHVIELKEQKLDELKQLKKEFLRKMFPAKGCDTPEIRFPGFTGAWEQRKLGELGTITTGSTPSTSIPDYYSDDGIVWVTPTDICENITFESARKLSDLGQQVGRIVPKNTILVTCIASIGKNTMLGNTGSFNQQINGLTPNENECDPYFLLTESALWSAKMKSSAAAGTMQIVNRTEFSELKTWLPSLIEQQAISDFFRQLDNLITLHQRELEETKTYKKTLAKLLLTGIVRVQG